MGFGKLVLWAVALKWGVCFYQIPRKILQLCFLT